MILKRCKSDLFMRKHRNMALDAALRFIGYGILRSPLSLAARTLKFAVALLAALVRSQFVVRSIEALKLFL